MDIPIIDRRTQGKGKNVGNVERFQRRFSKQIKEAAERTLSDSVVGDIKDADVHIPKRDMQQPVFGHGDGGTREVVHPGNKKFIKGDRIPRPEKENRRGSGSGDGEGEDDFIYHLSKKDVLGILFDGLKLPNMVKKFLLGEDVFKLKNAGVTHTGSPNNLHVVRSFRQSLGRRIALNAPRRKEISELEKAFLDATTDEERASIQLEIDRINARPRVPFLDPIDLSYRNKVRVPQPQAKAVVFRLMDVSYSMDEKQKNDAKLFYTLLGMFLEKDYDQVELINIRYTIVAKECNNQEFFYSPETGGTYVTSAVKLMKEIIDTRYASGEWNIYGALASDGDTGSSQDNEHIKELVPALVSLCQHFFYIELEENEGDLGEILKKSLAGFKNFSMRTQVNRENIFDVFRGFLKQRGIYDEPRQITSFAPAGP